MIESRNDNVGIVRFISLICIISNLSYYPVFVANGLGRIVAISAWIVLGVIAFSRRSVTGEQSTHQSYLLLYIVFLLNTIIVGTANEVDSFSNHFFLPVTISFIVFTLSNWIGNDIGKSGLQSICTAYYYVMAVISVPLFFVYLRGTDLVTSIYGYQYGKNEIAVLLLCATIIACLIYEPQNRLTGIIRVFAVIFFILDILLLRARSVFAGILLLAVIIVANKSQLNSGIRAFVILAIIIFTIYFLRNEGSFNLFLRNIVYAGRASNSINDISSGRINQIGLALSTFIEHPIIGIGKRFTCDCMFASVLANYGLLSWPLWIMALKPMIWSIKNYNRSDRFSICLFVMAFSFFVISLLEEQAPFGPGVRCYILWLFWGIILNCTDHEET